MSGLLLKTIHITQQTFIDQSGKKDIKIENAKRHDLPTPPCGQDVTQGQIFLVKFNKFKFRVFLPLEWLPNQG